jgi:hypothetical protein
MLIEAGDAGHSDAFEGHPLAFEEGAEFAVQVPALLVSKHPSLVLSIQPRCEEWSEGRGDAHCGRRQEPEFCGGH